MDKPTEYIKREDAQNEMFPALLGGKPCFVLTDKGLHTIPSADVVEVVRCKDCEYSEELTNDDMNELCESDGEGEYERWCYERDCYVCSDGFCERAKHKDGDAHD